MLISLKYLDVRDTPITDSDIQCFNITTTLREILMDCPVAFRDIYTSTDYEVPSDTDDGDSEKASDAKLMTDKTTSNDETNEKKSIDDTMDAETESESEDESECSSDSEDDNSDGENGIANGNGNNEEAKSQPHQTHCIQVILQNGRMINVNAERSNEFENPMRETNSLRCVIGIINGRGVCYRHLFTLELMHL